MFFMQRPCPRTSKIMRHHLNWKVKFTNRVIVWSVVVYGGESWSLIVEDYQYRDWIGRKGWWSGRRMVRRQLIDSVHGFSCRYCKTWSECDEDNMKKSWLRRECALNKINQNRSTFIALYRCFRPLLGRFTVLVNKVII